MILRDIQNQIDEFVLTNPKNFVGKLETISTTPTSFSRMKIWETPLIGVASAADPLWVALKNPVSVGPQHKSPDEWMPEAKSVISYFLPYTERIRSANRIAEVTATEWLYGRWEGEILNEALRSFIVDMVEKNGGRAIAPIQDQRYEVVDLRSNWSERHVAFIAGLGTFSLSRALITKRGSAGRFGSVIVDFSLEPTQREYSDIYEYCSKCMACARRCPPQAIDKNGKDNQMCRLHIGMEKEKYSPRYGCAKCQAGVPCEAKIPGK
nr:epoxyqueuosine reductase [uncultured Anaeromusa sp.]